MLKVARIARLFQLSRRIHSRGTGILCYHGYSLNDESIFRPSLFMDGVNFAKRLELLRNLRMQVIDLDEFVEKRNSGSTTISDAVITIDDGFYSTYAIAAPALLNAKVPATVYVTTYYVAKDAPVLNLVIHYALWKAKPTSLRLDDLIPQSREVAAAGAVNGDEFALSLCSAIETLPWSERVETVKKICERLGVSYTEIDRTRMFGLMRPEELSRLEKMGLRVELHTHRHRFPNDRNAVATEIEENRAAIMEATGRKSNHFCYPSGEWHTEQVSELAGLGVRTAVTCEKGLAMPADHELLLPRFVDSNAATDLDVEAFLSGFWNVADRVLRRNAGYARVEI